MRKDTKLSEGVECSLRQKLCSKLFLKASLNVVALKQPWARIKFNAE